MQKHINIIDREFYYTDLSIRIDQDFEDEFNPNLPVRYVQRHEVFFACIYCFSDRPVVPKTLNNEQPIPPVIEVFYGVQLSWKVDEFTTKLLLLKQLANHKPIYHAYWDIKGAATAILMYKTADAAYEAMKYLKTERLCSKLVVPDKNDVLRVIYQLGKHNVGEWKYDEIDL